MASVAATCPICSERYKSSEEIFSTNCGHVFHTTCLRQWQLRSLNCPSCRSLNSQGHKIYLSFEEDISDSENKILHLKSQLDQAILNASVLQQNLDESERYLLNVQTQSSKYQSLIDELNKKNEYLTVQNESRIKDVEKNATEIYCLQEELNNVKLRGPSIVLQEEINILKAKLKHTTFELNKEIENSIKLSSDKVRLQSMLEHTKKSLNSEKKNQNSKPKQIQEKTGCMQSVLIKNVPNTFDNVESMNKYVLRLVELMNLTLKAEDIQQLSVLDRKNSKSMSLLVKFSTQSSKIQFLAGKSKLQEHEDTKDLVLHEFLADKTSSLLHQAKSLKDIGYKHIYCRNNKVFVRKDDKSVAIKIDKPEDIDELKQKANKYEQIDNTNSPTTSEALNKSSNSETNSLIEL